MKTTVTIRIDIVDEVGRPLATVEKITRKDTGSNPRFLLPELAPAAEKLLDETLILAGIAVDHTRAQGVQS